MRVGASYARGLVLIALTVGMAMAQPAARLTAQDRDAIQALVSSYARALAECRAEAFADLFVPETGYFASGFRGHIVGRDKLIELVRSERHCLAPAGAEPPARPGGGNGPTVEIESVNGAVRGIANLGTAEYQDEYARTPLGWRFAARTVIIAAEKAAGLNAQSLLAIQRLGGADLGDHYEVSVDGVTRFLSSGVRVDVAGERIMGRAYLADGGFRDEVYEQTDRGEWRVTSSAYTPPPGD